MGDVNESLEDLNKAIDRLMEDRDAALRRAEAAEAERRDAVRRENAANLEREQSARLRYRAEVALLRWDTQAIGAALGLPIGADVPDRAVGAIKTLRERIQMAESERDRCCDDYQREAARAEKAEAEVARLKFVPYEGGGLSPVTYKEALAHTEQERDEARAKVARLRSTTLTASAPLCDQPHGEPAKMQAAMLAGLRVKAAGGSEQDAAIAMLREMGHDAPSRPPEPYTPRVGDVVLFYGEPAESAEASPRVVTSVEPDGWWSCVHLNGRRDAVACGPFRISVRIGEVRLHRPATPAERAAAGLPVETEAPAQPQVLPEHLAYLEAMAFYFGNPDFGRKERLTAESKAHALRAAVARRDGGGK